MEEKQKLSRQQQKSKETKERIFRAAKSILQEKGYEALSIKNICEEAGVSNGSFYHHFKTKDDLLSYYIEDQPSINPDILDLPANAEEAKTTIIHVYLNYAQYCRCLLYTSKGSMYIRLYSNWKDRAGRTLRYGSRKTLF